MVKQSFSLVTIFLMMMFTGCAQLLVAPSSLETPSSQHREVFLDIEKADSAYNQSRWQEAGQYYRKVIQRVPEDHYAWFRLGNTQLRQGQVESAIYTYKQAGKRNPMHAKTQYNLAMSHLMNALESLQRSGQLLREEDPGLIIVQQKMVQLRSLLEQPEEIPVSPGRQPLR